MMTKMMTKYAQETIEIAISNDWQTKIVEEVRRLVSSGMIDENAHSRGMVFGVALENIADNYLRGDKNSRTYKRMRMV